MTRQSTRGAPGWRENRQARLARDKAAHRGRIQAARRRRHAEPDDDDDAPATHAQRGLLRYDRLPVALVGFLLLALWWAVGGRYTIDGTPLLINAILAFFHVSARLGAVTDPAWYLKLCWVPLLISWIERRNRPRWGMAWNVAMVYAVGIWLLVSGGDLGSTWLAITHPEPDAWPLAQQVATIPLLAVLWTVATTFAPEIGFAALWKYLRG